MKCTNCGGELVFEGGIATCPSCGSKHKLDNIFEKIDIYLCYTEYDNAGRRTKASIIAQEVYNKLESQKISVFYERISASNCTADEIELLRQVAIHNAPIIIVIGASKDNFEAFTQKYGEHFSGKRVIPFFADINPSDIPPSLNKLQAVNYEKIGWEKDLVTGVLNILGRNDEVNIENILARSRKKKLFFILTGISLCVLLIGALLFYSLSNSKNQDTEHPVTKLQMYENAADLTRQGKLLEAAEIYLQILDFKDSQQLLDSVYSKYYSNYSGVYLSDDKKTMLSLDIKNNTSVEVVYRHNKDGDKRHYSATTTADIHIIEFDDVGKIELLDKKIKFSLVYPYDSSLNVFLEFTFEQKGDLDEYNSGIREELLSFFNPDIYPVDYGVPFVTLEDLFLLGYNLTEDGSDESIINSVLKMDYATKNSYDSTIVGKIVTPQGTDDYYNYDRLKNYHEASYYYCKYNEENDIIFEFDATGNYSQVHNVLSVFGRASLLTPDKIGKKPTDFTENGVVYSYVGAGDVLQKDDWVNITSYNPDYLKEYNEEMKPVEIINSTDFSNEESVFALKKYDLTARAFMNSNYKLDFYYYANDIDRLKNYEVYEIIGTDYLVAFQFYKNDKYVISEIFHKEEQNGLGTTTPINSFCKNCGKRDVSLNADRLCEDCADGNCNMCGGPNEEGHDCDDYPNAICPNCGWGIFITGVGSDGIICPDCGTKVV